MTLRRKLLTIFFGLGALALTIVGITFWTLVQWRESNALLQDHYQRSLLVQRISTSTFRAFKELPDAAFAGDPNARSEFRALLAPVQADFEAWSRLAHSAQEREQVRRVRGAYDALVADAEAFFEALAAGQRQDALELLEARLENEDFGAFGAATDAAIASDRANRQRIRERNERVRRGAWTVLAVAAFATLSLILLLAAYLSSDLFKPLRRLHEALDRAARGDLSGRLDEERRDEFGAVNGAFNRLSGAVQSRERVAAHERDLNAEDGQPSEAVTSRRALHRLVRRLRTQVVALGAAPETAPETARQDLLIDIDRLSHTVLRLSEFGFPLDLTLADTDLRGLLYEVVVRFHERFAARSVSFDLRVDPELGEVVIDRLKVREVLSELLDNALKALPERGGQLGLRARLAEDKEGFILEVADDGRGADSALLERALSLEKDDDAGLKLSKAVVEAHGGGFTIESEPGEGTYVRLWFPLYRD